MVDIDSEMLFDGAAAVVCTIAVLFFVFNVDFAYSPVSKVALVTLLLAGVFAITQRTDDRQLTMLGYGVVVTSSVGLFFDVVGTFGVDDWLTVAGLLGIAAVLFGLRTRLGEDNHFVTGTLASQAFGVLAILTVVVLVVDVATGGLAYELQPENEVEFDGSHHGEVRAASVVVTNPTPFPERVQTPNYGVCTAGNWSTFRQSADRGESERPVRVNARVADGYNEHVFGFGTKTYPVELHVDGADLQGETFPVRTTPACPDEETGTPYVALFETSDDYRYGRPV